MNPIVETQNSGVEAAPKSPFPSIGHIIHVADETLVFRAIELSDATPTGAQIARAAGFKPPDSAIVLQMLPDGALETIRPEEMADLNRNGVRFVVAASDKLFLFKLDGERYEWPSRIVSGGLLRKLAEVASDQSIYLERVDHPDLLIGDHDLVDLNKDSIESFITRKAVWKLNVHGVTIESMTPTISASEALERAGFDVTKPWHIFFKAKGQPRVEVALTDQVDLAAPGTEKLLLIPRNVDNGEGPPAPRREFVLLDSDVNYLGRLGLPWETIIENDRRWLLIRNYPLPAGYTATGTLLALEIPPAYPDGAIYGFYAYPPLALASGREIPSTQLRGVLLRCEFHGWSRHRGAQAPWDPATDSVITQLGLVEAALAKEVEQ